MSKARKSPYTLAIGSELHESKIPRLKFQNSEVLKGPSVKVLYYKENYLIGVEWRMAALWVEFRCPEHGLERFRIKIIKKHNVNTRLISPKFRTRPRYELSGLIVGRNVNYSEAKDYLVQYFKQVGLLSNVISIKFQK